MSGGTEINIIPLPVMAGDGSVPQESRAAMRVAVIQALRDLFVARVPTEERAPFFDTARDLLPQSGWGPVEMIEAADPGPRQDALFRELGLELADEAANDG